MGHELESEGERTCHGTRGPEGPGGALLVRVRVGVRVRVRVRVRGRVRGRG